jgi:hypothetical protein
MAKQIWYYMLGGELLDTMDEGGIPLLPVTMFTPPPNFVWLSVNPTWEVARSLCPPNSNRPLTMQEMAALSSRLYRIGIDPGIPSRE